MKAVLEVMPAKDFEDWSKEMSANAAKKVAEAK
jgi:heme/copper-type cytochrome/quinol oxidase subunit 2